LYYIDDTNKKNHLKEIFRVMKRPTELGDKYINTVLSNLSLKDLPDEQWESIEDFENYAISNYGRVKSLYGSPRITFELNSLGYRISQITVAKYMKELGLRSKLSKKFKVTTNSKHNCLVVENVLNRNFIAEKPAQVWVSDITYIQTKEGFLYLTTVMDLYDRKIIGWSLSDTMSTEETSLAAWKMAIKNRKIADGLIFHSDRGVQYEICEYR
jgi:putative transposase